MDPTPYSSKYPESGITDIGNLFLRSDTGRILIIMLSYIIILSYKKYRTVEFTTNGFGVKRCEVKCAKKT